MYGRSWVLVELLVCLSPSLPSLVSLLCCAVYSDTHSLTPSQYGPSSLFLASILLLSTIVHGTALSVKRAGVSYAAFVPQGCYAEPTSTRALVGNDYFDDEMTLAKCAAACSGYMYFGAEYGRECWVRLLPFLSFSLLGTH